MKNFIPICLFLSLSLHVLADDTIIISQTISLDSEYSEFDEVLAVARDSITLEPGFEFSSDTSSNFSTLLDPWDLDAPVQNLAPGTEVEPTGTLDGSYVVGSISGQPGVNPSGAATYSIPIAVPAGTKGMVPQLAIGYSSQAGNGIMGRGWNLSGLSSIVATGKTKYYDNESTNISSTDTACRVVWDGQRLFALNSVGLDADSFRTEILSNVKIERFGSDSTMWFRIKTPNGRTLEYGNTADSRMELDENTQWKWMLNKVYDRDGNAILYTYDTDEDICEILLSEIQYAGDTSISLVNTISLHYATRSDLSYAYIHDDLIINNKILDSISIESKNTYYGSYGFHYDNISGETLLDEVYRYDKDNNSFNPTVIGWDAPSTNLNLTGQLDTIYPETGFTYHSGDFTGDGVSDMVAVEINHTQGDYYYYLYKGSSSGLTFVSRKELPHSFTSQFWDDIVTSFDEQQCSSTLGSTLNETDIAYVFSGDFDGDGIMELFVKVMEWSELIFFLPPNLNSVITSSVVLEDYQFEYELCDFIPEITGGTPTMGVGMGCILNFDDNVSISDTLLRFRFEGDPDYDIQYTQFPDLDGRGFSSIPDKDYVYYYDPVEVSMDFFCNIPDNPTIWGEFNGDGKADYVHFGSSSGFVKTYDISTNSFISAETISGTYLGMIDLNGDGINAYVALGPEQFDTVQCEDLWNEWCSENTISCSVAEDNDWGDFLYEYGLDEDYADYWEGPCDMSGDTVCRFDFLGYYSIIRSLGYELYAKHLDGRGVDVSFGLFEGTNTASDPMFTRAVSVDINADGKSELLMFNEDSLLTIYHDFDPNLIRGEIIYSWSTENCNYPYGDELTMGDYNGDGIVDILFPESDTMLTFASGKPGKLVSSIINGMGNESRYTYKPMTDASVYTKDSIASFPVIDYTRPWYLTSSFSRDNGVTDSSYVEYKYEGAKIHLQGKGFLGFMQTTRENNLLNTSQITTLTYDTTHFNTYPVSSIQKVGTSSVAQSTVYTSVENVTGLTFSVQTDSTIKDDYLSGTTNTTRYSYNTDGFVSEKETQVDNLATITQNYTYTNAGWHVAALPEYVTTSYDRGGTIEMDSSVFSYSFTTGNPTQKIDFYGTPKQVTTKFNGFDTFGNPKETSVTAKRGPNLSLDSIESSMAYDSDGRFMVSKSDPMNFKRSFVFDAATGNLQSSTAENRTVTTYEYGPFNRAESATYPNMSQKASLILWVNGHDYAPTDALYYKWSSASGTAPLLIFYDATGRELRSVTSGFSNETIYTDTEYDSKGKVSRKSLPYFNDDTIWTTYTYDSYGRVLTETAPDLTITSYKYDPLQTTVIISNGSDSLESRTRTNALGETIESEDNLGNVVYFNYYPDGKLDSSYVSTHRSNGTSFTYDEQGNRTSITDPDAGIIVSSYDSFGQLLQQISAKDDTSSFEYDKIGRITRSIDERGSLLYSYLSDTTEVSFGMVDSIYNADKTLKEIYSYDPDFGRMLTQTSTHSGKSFVNTYSYDWFGRPIARTYPSGFEVQYSYNSNGDLNKVMGEGYTLWSCSNVNALGQITAYSQGDNSTTVTYNAYGKLNQVKTGTIMEMNYGFDNLGNLSLREDVITDQKEIFEYDDLNRLTGIEYYCGDPYQLAQDFTTGYDDCGNITSKTGVSSTINYGEGAGPHALTSIEIPEAAYKPPPQSITYNCFNKVSSISDTLSGGIPLSLDLTYGLANQRIKTVQTRNSTVERVKYFDGDYEEDSTATGVKKYHYIQGGSGLSAIFVMNGSGNDTMYYVLSDHLGSLTTIVNATTSEVEKYSFNAWGTPRDATDWTQSLSGELFADRGYTGHEHLAEFNLINMNGRVYDPILGRFLSPDPYVQAPGYPNNYNRYSYCLNNPLRFTDPSGYMYDPKEPTGYASGPGGEPIYQYLYYGSSRGVYSIPRGSGSLGKYNNNGGSWAPEAGPTYDYVYNWGTGQYDDFYGNGSISQSDWSTSTLSQMGYRGRSASSLGDAYNQLDNYTTTVFGTDGLGNQDVGILNTKTDHMTVYKVPFWEITGSYFNELYYFSGLVAFDTYQAQRELVATGASVDLTFAIGPVGFSIEAGNIEHKGGVHRFFSIGHAYGLEASISMNSISIREYPSSSFSPQDYAGWNTTKNYSFTYFTYGRESALQYTQSPYFTHGYKANQYSFGIGVLPIGWSEARTYTWVGKRRERYQYNFYDFK